MIRYPVEARDMLDLYLDREFDRYARLPLDPAMR